MEDLEQNLVQGQRGANFALLLMNQQTSKLRLAVASVDYKVRKFSFLNFDDLIFLTKSPSMFWPLARSAEQVIWLAVAVALKILLQRSFSVLYLASFYCAIFPKFS